MNRIDLLNEYTCVVLKDEQIIFKSQDKGIKPILTIINNKLDIVGTKVYDLIIGKAAAMLYTLLGVKKIITKTISERGLAFLEKNNIEVEYLVKTNEIINRMKSGICPMEETVINIDDPKIALELLKKKIQELGGK